ncbi:hypothetical protein BGZ52_006272 [Haplosporangium bisporale]|nr:hypothetical protein BGZ52_006272 [Haplosporangium bisporale]
MRALEILDMVKIYTNTIPSIVAGSGFEYLRQSLDRQQDLPYLASLVFVYRASPMKNDYHDVVKALEEFRPGVKFRFIKRCTTDEAL